MQEESGYIIETLIRLLGHPKEMYNEQTQFEFNCKSKTCSSDVNKYNLNFNLPRNIFNCFKCHYSGFITKLIRNYGTPDDIKRIEILFPLSKHHEEVKEYTLDENVICELPEGYLPLTNEYNTKYYYRAINYLKSRKIDMDMIKKYEIGYTETGPRKWRIIIPSRNIAGNINYYEARSYFTHSKMPYFKPDKPNKQDIIFNAKNINFDLPVYLVEGVFDMMPLANALPMLGKNLSPLIIHKFLQHKTKVILCLDEDAMEDTIKLYEQLTALGLDVYFVEVKDDIAKYYEMYGRTGIVALLRTYRKLDFQYMFNLKLNGKKRKKKYDDNVLDAEWIKHKQDFKDLNK